MEKKIIFFDIDGTLYAGGMNGIHQCVKDAIQRVRHLGHVCFVASGRPYGYIADNVKDVHFDGYVLANGANIKYNNQDLETRFMNQENVKQFVSALKMKQIEYVLQTSTYCYMSQNNDCFHEFYKKCNIDFKNFCYEYDEEEVMERTVKMEVWAKNQEEIDYVCNHCQDFAFEIHPDQHSMEVYASDVSKATGILDVLKLLDINQANSYCFGDGPNDVEMFETVAHPIAMGNAIDVIKDKAEDICLSVYEDGVAVKLNELF